MLLSNRGQIWGCQLNAEKRLSVVLTLVSPLWLASLNIHVCLSGCWGKLTPVVRVHQKQPACDKHMDDVTAMWHYKSVNTLTLWWCHGSIQQEESDITSQTGEWRPGSLCAASLWTKHSGYAKQHCHLLVRCRYLTTKSGDRVGIKSVTEMIKS